MLALALGIRSGDVWAAGAVVPRTIAHQGRLIGPDDLPVNTAMTLDFELYDQSAGGEVVWAETKTVQPLDGFYTMVLGAETPIRFEDFRSGEVYLSVVVHVSEPQGGVRLQPLEPRLPLASAPFAVRAELADRATEADHAARATLADHAVTAGSVLRGTIEGSNIRTSTITGARSVETEVLRVGGRDFTYADGSIGLEKLSSGNCRPGQVARLETGPGGLFRWNCSTLDTVEYAGTGTLSKAARADHTHDDRYVRQSDVAQLTYSRTELGAALERRRYSVVVAQQGGTCPAGFTAEPVAGLAGTDRRLWLGLFPGGTFLGGADGLTGAVGGVRARFDVDSAPGATLCRRTHVTSGRPHASLLASAVGVGSSTACPEGYVNLGGSELAPGADGFVYALSGADGLYLGGAGDWANAGTSRGGAAVRRWRPGEVRGACLRVMGVEDDSVTAAGVFPVVLGVTSRAVCDGLTQNGQPAGFQYLSAFDALRAPDYASSQNPLSALSITNTATLMGAVGPALSDTAHDGGAWQTARWGTGSRSINYCFRHFVRSGGRPVVSAQGIAAGRTCPSGTLSVDAAGLVGPNGKTNVQVTADGAYIGGWDEGARSASSDGALVGTVSPANTSRLCLQLGNVQ